MVDAFRKLADRNDVSVIMTTHNLELTKACNRVIKLRDGVITEIEENKVVPN